MEKSVKEYILSHVFDCVFAACGDIQVLPSIIGNGFSVVFTSVIPSDVFDLIYCNRAYFKKHRIGWYVSAINYPDCSFKLPCIRFFDDVEE